MITVTFDERELQALLQLMDIAVKTNGLQSAGSAFILQQKLMNAYQATLEPQPPQLVSDNTAEA